MKCLVCPAEIDEKKEIPAPPPGSDQLARARAEIEQRDHSAKLNAWRQVLVTVDNGLGGINTILQGHVCPNEELTEGSVSLVKGA
jgi:hypothetical protein